MVKEMMSEKERLMTNEKERLMMSEQERLMMQLTTMKKKKKKMMMSMHVEKKYDVVSWRNERNSRRNEDTSF